MPKIIVNSGYIKNTSHFVNYINYAGNKLEAQALVMNDGSVQEVKPDSYIDVTNDQLMENVSSIRITFKEGFSRDISIADYAKHGNLKEDFIKETAMIGADGEKMRPLDPVTFVEYIAYRPGVEKKENESHGLFDLYGTADIKQAVQTAKEHENHIKWSHIISLTREDAERTGFDSRKAWENLVRSKAYDIAKVYNISPKNLVMYGAYHDKTHHPHIHLFFYSKDKREGFVKGGKEALIKSSDRLRSMFLNTIFQEDVSHLKELKQTQEKQLQQKLKEVTKKIGHKRYIPNIDICRQFESLSMQLQGYTGRPYYGYLPKEVKQEVDSLLQTIVKKDRQVKEVFTQYLSTQEEFVSQYNDQPEKIKDRMDSFSERFFSPKKQDNRSFHNLIVQHALRFNRHDVGKNKNEINSQTLAQDAKATLTPVFDGFQEGNSVITVQDDSIESLLEIEPAKQENQYAQHTLGKTYIEGEKVPQNMLEGIRLLTASVEQGNQFAEYTLGKFYLEGEKVPQNMLEGIRLLTASANQGNQFAQYTLGKAYLEGKNVPKNMLEGIRLLTASANQGNQFAQYALNNINSSRKLVTYATNTLLYALCRSLGEEAVSDFSKNSKRKRKKQVLPKKHKKSMQKKKHRYSHEPSVEH